MERTKLTSQELSEIGVRPVERSEEGQYQEQMKRHHYLGALAKIGETVWYVATWRGQWVAQLSLSASALKCGVRDRWIGWDFRSQYGRLKLIANNSRFLILPGWNRPNVGSRVLSGTERRAGSDWRERFGHGLLLLENPQSPDGRKVREECLAVPRDTLVLMGGPVANLLAVLEDTLEEGEV